MQGLSGFYQFELRRLHPNSNWTRIDENLRDTAKLTHLTPKNLCQGVRGGIRLAKLNMYCCLQNHCSFRGEVSKQCYLPKSWPQLPIKVLWFNRKIQDLKHGIRDDLFYSHIAICLCEISLKEYGHLSGLMAAVWSILHLLYNTS